MFVSVSFVLAGHECMVVSGFPARDVPEGSISLFIHCDTQVFYFILFCSVFYFCIYFNNRMKWTIIGTS